MSEVPPPELLASLPTPRGVAVAQHGRVTSLVVQRWRITPLIHLAVILAPLALLLEWLLGMVKVGSEDPLWLAWVLIAAMGAVTWWFVSQTTDRVQLEASPHQLDVRSGGFPGHSLGRWSLQEAAGARVLHIDRFLFRDTWSLVLTDGDGAERVMVGGLANQRQADFLAAHLHAAVARHLDVD